MDDDEKLRHFLDHLVDSTTEPGEIQACPICAGRLLVSFGAYQRGNESMLGITAECESCGKATAIDYRMPRPTWLVKN